MAVCCFFRIHASEVAFSANDLCSAFDTGRPWLIIHRVDRLTHWLGLWATLHDVFYRMVAGGGEGAVGTCSRSGPRTNIIIDKLTQYDTLTLRGAALWRLYSDANMHWSSEQPAPRMAEHAERLHACVNARDIILRLQCQPKSMIKSFA